MKFYLYIYAFIILFFLSCEEDFNRSAVTSTVVVKYGSQFGSGFIKNASVSLKNSQKSVTVTGKTDEFGRVTFHNLDPGFYTVKAVNVISSTEASRLSGLIFNDSLVFNASGNLELLETSYDTLSCAPAFKSKVIIREFYYAGSTINTEQKYIADQYIEIYNNSNTPQDIGGYLIAEHESYGNGFNPWSDIKDSVVVKMIFQIPHDSEKATLLPGKSVVIARDAIDHKDDINGNPLSPVNLGNADFEFYLEGNDNADIDTKAENLIEVFNTYRGTDVTFHTRNGGGILLLNPSEINIEEYIINHRIKKFNVSGSSFKYVAVLPNSWAMDAIDVLRDLNSEAFKRFPDELDAGFTYNSKNGSGTCISRRLLSDEDGLERYMDTNNSSVDFLVNQIPNPKLND